MQKRFLNVNGVDRTIIVDPEVMLADVIRKQMHLTGTKVSCNDGHCGACSVMVDGKLTLACITPLKRVPDGAKIVTVEGIGQPGNLHPIQAAMAAYGAAQCGFCTPGMVVSTKALLDKNPNPTREEVRAWFTQHHNACRCTGYKPIVDAVMEAAAVMRGEKPIEDILFKMPKDGRIWGSELSAPDRRAEGRRHVEVRSGPGPGNAGQHAATGVGAGQSLARQHPLDRHERSREDAGRLQGRDAQGCEGQESHHRPDHLPDQQG